MKRILIASLLVLLTGAEIASVAVLVNLNYGHSPRVTGAWVKWYQAG